MEDSVEPDGCCTAQMKDKIQELDITFSHISHPRMNSGTFGEKDAVTPTDSMGGDQILV